MVAGGGEGKRVVAVSVGVGEFALVVLLPCFVEIYHFGLVALELHQQEIPDFTVLEERVCAGG